MELRITKLGIFLCKIQGDRHHHGKLRYLRLTGVCLLDLFYLTNQRFRHFLGQPAVGVALEGKALAKYVYGYMIIQLAIPATSSYDQRLRFRLDLLGIGKLAQFFQQSVHFGTNLFFLFKVTFLLNLPVV